MSRKNNNVEVPPLARHWMPPKTQFEFGVGQPWACIATTFEFDAGFFETELLPRFLGLKFDHTENEPSFLGEREEALALARVGVLMDQSRFDSAQSTMRWDQIPIQVLAGILHAKITILAWERLLRMIVGSANMTRTGYRRNREVFAALDFWNDSDSIPLRLLRDTLDLLVLILEWSRVAPSVRDRTSETIALSKRLPEWRIGTFCGDCVAVIPDTVQSPLSRWSAMSAGGGSPKNACRSYTSCSGSCLIVAV